MAPAESLAAAKPDNKFARQIVSHWHLQVERAHGDRKGEGRQESRNNNAIMDEDSEKIVIILHIHEYSLKLLAWFRETTVTHAFARI